MLARHHAPAVRRLVALHPARNRTAAGLGAVGDELDDMIMERLRGYATELSDQAYASLMARLPQLTDDLRPYVRQLADEALTSEGVVQAKEELKAQLKEAFVTSTGIAVAASFAASFLAEAWEMSRKRR